MLNPWKIQTEIEILKKSFIPTENKDKNSILSEIDILESRKNYLFQIYTMFIAILALCLTLFFSLRTESRLNQEFELKIRPYLFIDNIDGTTDMVSTVSDYKITIKNSGGIPAILKKETIICNGTLIDGSSYSTTTVEGRTQSDDFIAVNAVIISHLHIKKTNQTTCTIILDYVSAPNSLSQKKYQTQQVLLYRLGREISSLGGVIE